jgi:hypothetical protein
MMLLALSGPLRADVPENRWRVTVIEVIREVVEETPLKERPTFGQILEEVFALRDPCPYPLPGPIKRALIKVLVRRAVKAIQVCQ